MLNSALTLAAAEGHHAVHELPIPPIWYGIIAFLLFLALLGAVLSMRSVGLRHVEPTTAVRHHADGAHTAGHGTAGHGATGSHSAGH